MTEIPIPQSGTDVYSFGFDRSLNKDVNSSVLGDDSNNTSGNGDYSGITTDPSQGVGFGYLIAGSQNSIVVIDPARGLSLGNAIFASAPFRVNMNGELFASSGSFTGDITGATGTFTGTVSVGSINIPNSSQANSFHVAGGVTYGGDTWWGANATNGTASANAYVLNNGSATFKNINVGGTTRQFSVGNNGIYNFGDGSDAVATFDGVGAVTGATLVGNTYTLTRDVYYTNATVSTGVTVNPGGYRMFGLDTLTENGTATVGRNGNTGSNGTDASSQSGGAGGAGAAPLADGYLKGAAAGSTGATGGGGGNLGNPGGVGSTGNNGSTTIVNSLGSASSSGATGGAGGNNNAGGTGGAGGPGGNAGSVTNSNVKLIANWHLQTLLDIGSTGSTVKFDNSATPGSAGGGGGGGGGAAAGGGGGGGGGSGTAGGIVAIYFRNIVIGASASITANGGTGGVGGKGWDRIGNANTGGGGGGAGGTGGNGGQVILVYNSLTNSGTLSASGGAGGTGGVGGSSGAGAIGTSSNGPTGTAGQAGTVRQFQVSL